MVTAALALYGSLLVERCLGYTDRLDAMNYNTRRHIKRSSLRPLLNIVQIHSTLQKDAVRAG